MRDILRQFIAEALEEIRNANVPQQLLSKGRSGKGKPNHEEEEDEKEVEEMSTVGGSLGGGGGFTAPLGLSSEDMKNSSRNDRRSGRKR
jgi:hypothetical protein